MKINGKERGREVLGEGGGEKYSEIFFSYIVHTISDSPCTAIPLYNSTGRLNILRMLSSLFVSTHEPSGDLKQ